MSLTIAFITARNDDRIEWFIESLAKQLNGESFVVPVIDLHAENRDWETVRGDVIVLRHPPKPTVWSGKHRLTKENWFSAANSRNTALCLCRTTHIAFVDDLSVLQPGWYGAAKEAAELSDTITCGAYSKVKNLQVENGVAVSCDVFPGGVDNRLSYFKDEVSPCAGNCLYGCSLVAPVEALLSVDGFGEHLCDGLGFEDVLTGIVLENAGYKLRYDKRLMTLESEELHHVEPPMLRSDYGKSPADKSHAALNIALQSKIFDNGYVGGLRAERERVLRGESWTIRNTPEHEWFTKTPLRELLPQ